MAVKGLACLWPTAKHPPAAQWLHRATHRQTWQDQKAVETHRVPSHKGRDASPLESARHSFTPFPAEPFRFYFFCWPFVLALTASIPPIYFSAVPTYKCQSTHTRPHARFQDSRAVKRLLRHGRSITIVSLTSITFHRTSNFPAARFFCDLFFPATHFSRTSKPARPFHVTLFRRFVVLH